MNWSCFSRKITPTFTLQLCCISQCHHRTTPGALTHCHTQILSVRMLPNSEDSDLVWNNSDQYSVMVTDMLQVNISIKKKKKKTGANKLLDWLYWQHCIMQAYSHLHHTTLSAGIPVQKIPESNHVWLEVEFMYLSVWDHCHSPILVFYLCEGFITRLWLSWRSWM